MSAEIKYQRKLYLGDAVYVTEDILGRIVLTTENGNNILDESLIQFQDVIAPERQGKC
jgi:hypothetical protein